MNRDERSDGDLVPNTVVLTQQRTPFTTTVNQGRNPNMVSPRQPLTLVLMTALVICFASIAGRAQQQEPAESAAGAGWLAPGVFATWEAHRDAAPDGQPATTDAAPL